MGVDRVSRGKDYFELNENENTTYQDVWSAAEAVL